MEDFKTKLLNLYNNSKLVFNSVSIKYINESGVDLTKTKIVHPKMILKDMGDSAIIEVVY